MGFTTLFFTFTDGLLTMSETLQIVCPSCGAINRIPAGKDPLKAKCGKCGGKLFNGKPVEVDDALFAKMVTKNSIPVVVDFWAEWCGPCKMMAPEFAKVAAEMEPRARFVKVDTERNQATAAQFRIMSIPTLMIFRDGRPVAQTAGAMPASQLRQWIEANI